MKDLIKIVGQLLAAAETILGLVTDSEAEAMEELRKRLDAAKKRKTIAERLGFKK